MTKPNILIITTDQQSHHMMSCAGNTWLSTPNMDRIANWGCRLTRAYCSNPVCVPSRYSWWTGRMPSSIGLRHNSTSLSQMPPEVPEGGLGHWIERAGYKVAFGGKVHCPLRMSATDLGFDYFQRDERDLLAVDAAHFIRQDHARPWLLAANFINPHDICYQAIRAFAESDFDHRLLDKGAKELNELDQALTLPQGVSEEDFFKYHCPPMPDNDQVPNDEPKAITWLVNERQFRKNARQKWTERDWRLHRWAYHRLTERVDRQIGVVLDALEASGQLENTVILFTSDHGDNSASHALEHKTVFYDEAVRVPLIIARPGHGLSGQTNTQRMSNVGLDLMATCCDFAGISPPSWNRGHSLRHVIEGKPAPSTASQGSYAENQIGFMWVSEHYKYCRFDICGAEEVLYDLRNDPGETRNAINDDALAEVVSEHRKALDRAMAEHGELVLTDQPS